MRTKISIALATLLFISPFFASAQTTDVQSQINALLAQIKQLQTLISQLQSPQAAPAHCVDLSNNLTLGSSGNDVTALQQYLIQSGVLDAQYKTGYYGFLTAKAVGAVQLKLGILASADDSAFGITGPQTRGAIACNSAQSSVSASSNATAPTCSVTATSNVIAQGGSTVITWSSNNATAASSGSDKVALKGSYTVRPSVTTTYTFTFTGPGGTTSCSQEVTVNATGATVSGLPTAERNALAQAIGYYGAFGVTDGDSKDWSAWRSGSNGQRDSVWNTLTARLLANPGDSLDEIYSLFPNLNPSYMTETGVTKSQRDAVLRSLGYTGMLNVQDASGVSLFGSNEWQSWLDANGKRAAFNAAIAPFLPQTAPVVTFTQTTTQTTSDGTTGQNFTVSWTVTGATSCTVQHQAPDGALEAAWGSGTSGSRVAVANKVGTHHYWIDCAGTGGSAHKDIYHVVVQAAPSVTLSQTSNSTLSDGTTGQNFTVSWSATGATSCTVQHITPNGTVIADWGTGTSGSRVAVANQLGVHTYTIDCSGPGGTTHQSLTHKVNAYDYGMAQLKWTV